MKKAVTLLALSSLAMLYGFSLDYPKGLQLQDGAIIPEPVVKSVFADDFDKPGPWSVENYEDHTKIEYMTYKGMKGMMVTNGMGKKGDTAWQIQSGRIEIPQGVNSYRLEVRVESSANLRAVYASPGYGPFITWLDKDGKTIVNDTYRLDSSPGAMRHNILYGGIPQNAVAVQLAYGYDHPNIEPDEYIFFDRISFGFFNSNAVVRGSGSVTSTPLPLSRNARFKAVADVPEGTSMSFSYSTTRTVEDVPDARAWTPFKPVKIGDVIQAAPDAQWIRWKVDMASSPNAYPALKSVSIGNLTDTGWTCFTPVGTPTFHHASKSPNDDRNAPLAFRVVSDLPVFYSRVNVALDGKPVTTKREGSVFWIAAPAGGFTDGLHIVTAEATAINGTSTKGDIWFWIGRQLPGPNMSLRDDGMTLIDGKPFFPVGIYSISKRKFNNYNFDEAFRGLKAAGFNMAHSYTDNKNPEFLAAAEKHGLKLFNLFHQKDGLMEMVLKCKNIIAWYVGDDTSAHTTPLQLQLLHDNLAAIDPSRICTQADGVRGYEGFEKCTECFMPEIYPIRELDEETARRCVGRIVNDMEKSFDNVQKANAGPRSIWAIVQYMEGWGGYKRFPTETEVRAMSWAAIATGAHGITWYTYAPGSEKNHGAMYSPETWRIMSTLATDISALHDVLAERAVKLPQPVVVKGPARNLYNRDAIVAIAKKHQGETWVFAVNTVMDPVTATITIPGCKDVTWHKQNRSAILKNNQFTEDFEPYGVRIFIAH